jgi:hypothetical protein
MVVQFKQGEFMKTIQITNQKEFDTIKDDFEGGIHIIGNLNAINKNFKNSIIRVYDQAVIESVYGQAVIKSVYGQAVIKSVYGQAVIESVYGQAVIKSVSGQAVIESVSGQAVIESVYGQAVIKSVYGQAVIESVYGQAVIKSVYGQAVIKSVYGQAVIKSVYGQAVIESVSGQAVIEYVSGQAVIESVYDQAVIEYVYDQAVIKYVYGQAVIESVYGQAVIKYVYDQAVIEYVYGNGTIKIFSSNVKVLKALQYSIIININCKNTVKSKTKLVTIINNPIAKHDKKSFTTIYEDQVENGKIKLYKSVNPDTLCDFHTGRIKYEDIVKPEKWNPDKNLQCGDGLHLSPLPHLALNYNQGKLLECEVDIKDFVVYPDDITKVRCRKVRVMGEYKEKNNEKINNRTKN